MGLKGSTERQRKEKSVPCEEAGFAIHYMTTATEICVESIHLSLEETHVKVRLIQHALRSRKSV
jgi:hypothetical protein